MRLKHHTVLSLVMSLGQVIIAGSLFRKRRSSVRPLVFLYECVFPWAAGTHGFFLAFPLLSLLIYLSRMTSRKVLATEMNGISVYSASVP